MSLSPERCKCEPHNCKIEWNPSQLRVTFLCLMEDDDDYSSESSGIDETAIEIGDVVASPTYEKDVLDGINLLWSFRVSEAEKVFAPFAKTDPRYAICHAECATIRAVIGEKPELFSEALSRLGTGLRLVQRLEKKEEELLRVFRQRNMKLPLGEDNTAYVLDCMRTELLLIRSELEARITVCRFRSQAFIRGGLHARRAGHGYEHASKSVETVQKKWGPDALPSGLVADISLGVGMFNIGVGMVPPAFKGLIQRVVGLKGSVPIGLMRVADSALALSGLRASLSLVAMIAFYFALFQAYDEAHELASLTSELFPVEFAPVQYIRAICARTSGQMEQSIAIFSQLQSSLSEELPQAGIICNYELGTTYFRGGHLEKAIDYLTTFLEESRTPSFRAWAAFQVALAYHWNGYAEEAALWWRKVPEYVRKNFSFDMYAKRLSEACLNQQAMSQPGFSEYLRAQTAFEGGFYDDALEWLNKGEDSLSKPPLAAPPIAEGETEEKKKKNKKKGKEQLPSMDIVAALLYYRGKVLIEKGDFDSAVNCFSRVIAMKTQIYTETYVVPHAHVEMAYIHTFRSPQDIPAAKASLAVAANFKHYDFTPVLNRRIKLIQLTLDHPTLFADLREKLSALKLHASQAVEE